MAILLAFIIALWIHPAPAFGGPRSDCGNGQVEMGEFCDDGNVSSNDGCDATCRPEVCGDEILSVIEQCDDGNTISLDGCSALCTLECGNGFLDPIEECDDSNRVGGDGCSPACMIERCGNGIFDVGEDCDDGNTLSGDGCDANCTPSGCGNGVTAGSEQCDDGGTSVGDGCSSSCRLEICGNGVIDVDEDCDDGDTASGDGCSESCVVEQCGNLVLDVGEQCDDGDLVSGDGCDANCTTTTCGNGIATENEQCDDGNAAVADGCDLTCTLDFGVQTRTQQACIVEVNRRIAGIARAQAKDSAACLKRAASGETSGLGPTPADMDSCLGADVRGVVARARAKLLAGEARRCFTNEPPELALGDHLAGSDDASALVAQLTRDLLGEPPVAFPRSNQPASRCQTAALGEATKLFDTVWKEVVRAKKIALKGGRGAPPRNNAQLRSALEEALENSTRIESASDRVPVALARSCVGVPGLDLVVPGCAVSDVGDLVACVRKYTHCRACQLLDAADPGLEFECYGDGDSCEDFDDPPGN